MNSPEEVRQWGNRNALLLVCLAIFSATVLPADAQSILPPAPEAIGGGNPLQGLGRPDDPSPARYEDGAPKVQPTQSTSDSESTSGTGGQAETITLPAGTGETPPPEGLPPGAESGSNPGERTPATNTSLTPTENQTGGIGSGDKQKDNAASNKATAQEIVDKLRHALAGGKHHQGHGQGNDQLVPPPPPSASGAQSLPPTPERRALSLIHHGHYGAAEERLKDLLNTDPDNVHAIYLLAVTQVYGKKYAEAKSNYQLVIQKAQDRKLVEMAETGLQKLER